ncbi:MAG: C4-dicarboxylate TRAP transporter substrate-binding protein [Alphaproteobacteria bacterium]
MKAFVTTATTAVAALVLAGTVGTASADNINLRIASGHAPNIGYVTLMQNYFVPEVKKRVEAKTAHKVSWVEGYAGSIVKVNETLGGVQRGIIDLGAFCYCFEPANLPAHAFQVFLPFGPQGAMESVKYSRGVYGRIDYLPKVFDEKFGQEMLALLPFDSYQLGTKFEWKTVADLKGRKIAAAGPNLPWLQYAGAIPVQSGMPDAYTSLQTGVYEGWVMFPSVYYSARLHEQAPYYTLIGFGAITWHALTINHRTRDRLPKEVMDIMREVALDYENRLGEVSDTKYEENLKSMEKEGAKIVKLPDDVRAAWAESLKDFPREKAKELDGKGLAGTTILKTALEEAEKVGYKWPIRYKVD